MDCGDLDRPAGGSWTTSGRSFSTSDWRLSLLSRQKYPGHTRNILPAAVSVEATVLMFAETASLLKVGCTTVYDLIKIRGFDIVTIGRLQQVRYNDVVAYPRPHRTV